MKSLDSLHLSINKNKSPESLERSEIYSEAEAEELLNQLLKDPENAFLLSIPQNKNAIDNAVSSNEALKFAQEKIAKRIEQTMEVRVVSEIEGLEFHGLNYESLKRNIDSILRNAVEIGRGGDGFVVIDKSEIKTLPAEICYKFMTAASKPRGRNSTVGEFEMQEQFYASAEKLDGSRIGVPTPFYTIELGGQKMIAMEKLNAMSVDDILNGSGRIPEWFDVDTFCEELKELLTHFHNEGLYHRDMHFGNVMVSQSEVLNKGDKIGYIIDFGLSGKDSSGFDPYKKEEAGSTFTYEDDYGIIEKVRKGLRARQERA